MQDHPLQDPFPQAGTPVARHQLSQVSPKHTVLRGAKLTQCWERQIDQRQAQFLRNFELCFE